jgi:hypothetical protein
MGPLVGRRAEGEVAEELVGFGGRRILCELGRRPPQVGKA